MVSVLGSRVSGLGFRVSGLGFGFRVSGFGCRVSGLRFRVSGLGFRVSGLGFGFYQPAVLEKVASHAGDSLAGRATCRTALPSGASTVICACCCE